MARRVNKGLGRIREALRRSSILDLLTFEMRGQRCALLASEVLEVQQAVATTALPRAPAIVEGVVNLRGTLVPVLDIRARLGFPPEPLDVSNHLVFARLPRKSGRAQTVAIRVDRALDLVRVAGEQIEDPRPIVGAVQAAGVAKLADGLVVIHDLRTFLSFEDAQQLDQALLVAEH
ncbi:MAG: chemotaxis protein CheW [Myxococcales bacterium]|nr:chemotaxis protein CheW [Myxococcales bacterium]